MYLPDFEYYAPDSLDDALTILDDMGADATVLAGGTDVLHKMKMGKMAPKALVSVRKLKELKDIRHTPGRGLVIGAAVTHTGLMESPLVCERYFSIADAAHQMASCQIRNVGTVGGNIVNAVPSADLPPILIALGARIRLVGTGGERTIDLEDFFVEPASSVIKPNEILTEIIIPDQHSTGSRYMKFGLRRSGALAVAGAAVSLTLKGGVMNSVKIALSSSAPVVMRAKKTEKFLEGKKPVEKILAEAAEMVSAETRPRDSIRGSAEYRRHLAGVLFGRALKKSIETGHGAI